MLGAIIQKNPKEALKLTEDINNKASEFGLGRFDDDVRYKFGSLVLGQPIKLKIAQLNISDADIDVCLAAANASSPCGKEMEEAYKIGLTPLIFAQFCSEDKIIGFGTVLKFFHAMHR